MAPNTQSRLFRMHHFACIYTHNLNTKGCMKTFYLLNGCSTIKYIYFLGRAGCEIQSVSYGSKRVVFIWRTTNLTRQIQDEYKTIYSDMQFIINFDRCSLNSLARLLTHCQTRSIADCVTAWLVRLSHRPYKGLCRSQLNAVRERNTFSVAGSNTSGVASTTHASQPLWYNILYMLTLITQKLLDIYGRSIYQTTAILS